MEPVALSVGVALALLVLLRRPGVLAPVLVYDAGPGQPVDDEEQQPETDRAPPPQHWLGWTVASMAALRLLLLVTLHA